MSIMCIIRTYHDASMVRTLETSPKQLGCAIWHPVSQNPGLRLKLRRQQDLLLRARVDKIDREELSLHLCIRCLRCSDAVLSPQAELYRWSQSMRGTHSVGKTPNADLVTEPELSTQALSSKHGALSAAIDVTRPRSLRWDRASTGRTLIQAGSDVQKSARCLAESATQGRRRPSPAVQHPAGSAVRLCAMPRWPLPPTDFRTASC